MDLFLQLIVQGLATGGLYAVIGVSFGLIFNTTRVFHFTHGAVFTLGAYAIYFAVARLGLPLWVAMALGAAVTAVGGMACELLLYRPLRRRGASPLLWFLASFALLVVLQNVMLLTFGGVAHSLATGATRTHLLAGMRISELSLWKMAAGLTAAALVFALLRLTRMGKELRAIVSNPEMARIAGIDVDRCHLRAYALGSALTVPAAAIMLFDQGVAPDSGEGLLLVATVSVFAGGIGSFMGGALGGLAMGLASSLAVYWLPSSFQQTVALATLTLFLLWRPAGLLGLKMRRV